MTAKQKVHRKPGCLVTGVAGFVGSHLAERLLSLDFKVVGVDNYFSGNQENMLSFLDDTNFYFYETSVTEPRLLSDLKQFHPDLIYCFHLAAIVSVPYSMEHVDETMEVNYQATESLLKEATELGFNAFVFAGSAAEYGSDERLPVRERYASDQTQHLSPYGRSKYLASRCVANETIGVALRCFNIYGPRQDPTSPYSGVVSRFVDAALAGGPLTILGDGLQTRDFIYVSDVVSAYLHAAGMQGLIGSPLNGIYNVGTGQAVSILDLAATILELTERSDSLTFAAERPGDIRHSLADVSKFKAASGWIAEIPLHLGLGHTLEWARKQCG